MKYQLDRLIKRYDNVRIISGHAKGADTLAERYAAEKGIQMQAFPAEWNKYGKAAGPIRNRTMLEYAEEETPVVAAFWDGKSRGTENMLKLAKAADAECHIFTYKREREDKGHAERSGVV